MRRDVLEQISEGNGADLRRRGLRDLSETIVDAARWLMPEDRALLMAVFRDGMSAAEAAALKGRSPRRVRTRIRRLVSRIFSREFAFVVLHRKDWPPMRRRVATAVVLQGRSMRDAATHLHLTLHAVRTQMQHVRALIDAEQEARRSA